MSADRRFFLYQNDPMSAIGDVQTCLNSGNSSSNHQCFFGDRNLNGDQRMIPLYFFNQTFDNIDSLTGSCLPFLMYPRAMLTNISYLAQIRIQSGFRTCPPKGRFMHSRRTGSNDNAIQSIFFNGVLNQCLSRIGTHIFIIDGIGNAFHFFCRLGHFFAVDSCTDIFTAMADKNSYFRHTSASFKFTATK